MFYNYWIVRYIPNVIRGEFVNIGLLVGKDDADWGFREVTHLRRASRLGGDPTIARYWLNELKRMVSETSREPGELSDETLWTPSSRGSELISESEVQRLRGRLNNAVQISEARTVMSNSAAEAIGILFDLLVEDPMVTRRAQFRSHISREIEESFYRSVGSHNSARVARSPSISVGKSAKKADLAIADDHVEQLTKAWSFNLTDMEKVDTEIQAWAYFMEHIQGHGGTMTTADGRKVSVPEDVNFRVIYESPVDKERRRNVDAARDIWQRIPHLKVYSADQAQELVRDTVQLVS
jgi:hypothetical protein